MEKEMELNPLALPGIIIYSIILGTGIYNLIVLKRKNKNDTKRDNS
jgi:hypothetical protein